MTAKTKVIEIAVRVRVPLSMTARRAKEIVSGQWYGEVYPDGSQDDCDVLRPRWGKARVVRPQ